jgi:carboxyl-terminal processing protease
MPFPSGPGRSARRLLVAGAVASALTGCVLLAAAVLALVLGGGGASEQRPVAHAAAAAAGGARGVELRAEVLGLLADRYYRPIDRARLAGIPLADLGRALGDPYTAVLSPGRLTLRNRSNAGEYAGIGIHAVRAAAGVRIDAVTPGSPAAAAGLTAGTVVTAVDGRPAAGLRPAVVGRRLRGRPGSKVAVTVRGEGRTAEVTMTRRILRATIVQPRLVRSGAIRVGVIGVTEFSDGAGRGVRDAVRALSARGAGALVLDLRSNPGGLVREAVAVAGAFLPRGSVVYRMLGRHIAPLTRRTVTAPAANRLPLAVLINGDSASSAEIVASALHDHHRAVLVGTRTFGKGVLQDTVPLRAGGALKLTIAAYRTPAGTDIQHRGIEPDIVVADRPPPADPVMRRALRLLSTRPPLRRR